MLQLDKKTEIVGNIQPGIRVEAMMSADGHATSVKAVK
jgi:hypothetical protein